ncbi:hypothetical protein [Klebsiella aerogenes]|uniref:hypothetical protein n=1 Tax=Klebsiella aerogenes TaxID=548 RepID=UPI002DBC6F2D|nr:hypothetical protein [Klebsiella aerogenes]MEB7534198.1 hypothetical protein [Klebsiella aerogenes]
MNSYEYLNLVNNRTNDIFKKTISDNDLFSSCYYHANCLIDFSAFISDLKERELIKIVATQLESSAYLCALGLYRQCFSTLRLLLEMGLAIVSFSLNKLTLLEWEKGLCDISWSQIIDIDNGVLSTRVKKIFLDESFDLLRVNKLARETYRELSEFVHGNQSTFSADKLFINYDDELVRKFEGLEKKCIEVLFICYFVRYHNEIPVIDRDSFANIYTEYNHIGYIRNFFGGPKDI